GGTWGRSKYLRVLGRDGVYWGKMSVYVLVEMGWIVIGQLYNRKLIKIKFLLFRFSFLKGNYIM
ncbi:hypothetical protein EJD97_025400, partial [Solanum chilense]